MDEEHLQADGARQVYEYKGVHGPTETYRLIEKNKTELQLDIQNSKSVAAAIVELENTPDKQHPQWNGEEFIDVATGLVVEVGAPE